MTGSEEDAAVGGETTYPFARLIGFSLTAWAPDFARIELDIDARFDNRFGIPHGGIYATLLDTAMGHAGVYTGDPEDRRMSMTLSLTTNFLAQPRGTRLIADGRRIGGGKSTYFTEGVVQDETGEVLATGSGVFRYRRMSE